MATQNGTNYALQADPTGENILAPGLWHGRVRCQIDSFTFTGEAAGEIIQVAKLPLGARVLAIEVLTDGLGGAVTLEVGDSVSNVAYATGLLTTADAAVRVQDSGNLGKEIALATEQTILIETADAAATGLLETADYVFTAQHALEGLIMLEAMAHSSTERCWKSINL